MAATRLDRIEKDIEKTRAKITEYQNKLKGLETQRSEQENLEIVQIVKAMRLSPQELTAFLQNGATPTIAAATNGVNYDTTQEDTEDEE